MFVVNATLSLKAMKLENNYARIFLNDLGHHHLFMVAEEKRQQGKHVITLPDKVTKRNYQKW